MAKSKSKSDTVPVTADIKVVASKSCPSLSGNCTIAYKLGLDADNALHIRLHENSGGGFFNNEWYPAQVLADALRAVGSEESVTSRAFASIFRGRSANSPAFFAAVLRNEGALLPYKRTSRHHVVGDLDAFLRQGDQSAGKAKSTPRKKSAAKGKAPSQRKSKASPAK